MAATTYIPSAKELARARAKLLDPKTVVVTTPAQKTNTYLDRIRAKQLEVPVVIT